MNQQQTDIDPSPIPDDPSTRILELFQQLSPQGRQRILDQLGEILLADFQVLGEAELIEKLARDTLTLSNQGLLMEVAAVEAVFRHFHGRLGLDHVAYFRDRVILSLNSPGNFDDHTPFPMVNEDDPNKPGPGDQI